MIPTRLYESAWSEGSAPDLPTRYVLLQWSSKQEYSTHLEVKRGMEPHYIHGHYFGSLYAARDDLAIRIVRHNKDFPILNTSHIPGGTDSIKLSPKTDTTPSMIYTTYDGDRFFNLSLDNSKNILIARQKPDKSFEDPVDLGDFLDEYAGENTELERDTEFFNENYDFIVDLIEHELPFIDPSLCFDSGEYLGDNNLDLTSGTTNYRFTAYDSSRSVTCVTLDNLYATISTWYKDLFDETYLISELEKCQTVWDLNALIRDWEDGIAETRGYTEEIDHEGTLTSPGDDMGLDLAVYPYHALNTDCIV